ncbi:MAG: flgC [Ramlibacter sp.]|nr:flgC [Ramlibacter sp.]
MDYLQSFAISAAGMGVERSRVEVAAMNLANANTVSPPGAAPYQPLRVLARSASPFVSLVSGALAVGEPPVVTKEPTQAADRMDYDPGHPLDDTRGFVAHAAVDPATEMVTLMTAMRSYEANVAAMNTARSLALKTLDIGRAG